MVAPLLAVDVLLALATFMTGVHYAVDVVAAFAIFPCAVWSYRQVERLIEPPR